MFGHFFGRSACQAGIRKRMRRRYRCWLRGNSHTRVLHVQQPCAESYTVLGVAAPVCVPCSLELIGRLWGVHRDKAQLAGRRQRQDARVQPLGLLKGPDSGAGAGLHLPGNRPTIQVAGLEGTLQG